MSQIRNLWLAAVLHSGLLFHIMKDHLLTNQDPRFRSQCYKWGEPGVDVPLGVPARVLLLYRVKAHPQASEPRSHSNSLSSFFSFYFPDLFLFCSWQLGKLFAAKTRLRCSQAEKEGRKHGSVLFFIFVFLSGVSEAGVQQEREHTK